MTRAQDLMPIDRAVPDAVYFPLRPEQAAAVHIEERFVPGPAGAPDVRVVVTRPRAADDRLPLLIHVHGGAFCILHPDAFAGMEAGWALDHGCVVVSVDYRLAPEHPFPAAPEDSYAALCWASENAGEIGADAGHLVVTGGSAGGALAAALCLMARDRGGPDIAFQALMIPVLDDRLDQPSHSQALESPGFNGRAAEGMWLHYLGDDYDRSTTSPYAAPARAESLASLPPAFIQTNGLDPLRDEGLHYAMRLMAEGIDVELYNAPGAYHGADPLDPRTAVTAAQLYDAAIGASLKRR